MKKEVSSIIIAIAALVAVPAVAFAYTVENSNETYVESHTSATANSGGNTASGGEVVEGESHSSASVRTEINGEVFESSDEGTSTASVEQSISVDNVNVGAYGDATVKTSALSDTDTDTVAESETGTTSDTVEEGHMAEGDMHTESESDVAAATHAEGEGGVFMWIGSVISNIFSYVWGIF